MGDAVPGFFSYSHSDDGDLGAQLVELRTHLQRSVNLLVPRPWKLFGDDEHIEPGESWARKIRATLDAAAVLIPIVTPKFLESEECRREVRRFVDREQRLGRDDLIFPLVLAPERGGASREAAEIARILDTRQKVDIGELRVAHEITVSLRERLDPVAKRIADVVAELSVNRPTLAAEPPWPSVRDIAYIGRRRDQNHEVFVLLEDGRIWHTWWPGDDRDENGDRLHQWNEWWRFTPSPPGVAVAVAAASWGRQTSVFVLTDDGRIYRQKLDDGQWTRSWEEVADGRDAHGPFRPPLSAGSMRDGHIEVVALGGDGLPRHTWREEGRWHGWRRFDHMDPPRDPG